MNRFILFIAALFFVASTCIGQDTIRMEPSYKYTSDKVPYKGKAFAATVKLAREDIVFSETCRRIEYCYYYDNQRICGNGTTYQLTGDSGLVANGITWTYHKLGDRYFIERYFEGTYESGLAKSLIPLETIGLFTTTTADKADTLWTTDYSADNPARPYDHPLWVFHKTRVNGKIYASAEIDEPPVLPSGDSITTIHLNRTDGCFSEPYYFVKELKFIVTEEGRILNIEQSVGNLDLVNCPYYVMDLMRHLLQSGPLKPAKIKGQSVNVVWTLAVN